MECAVEDWQQPLVSTHQAGVQAGQLMSLSVTVLEPPSDSLLIICFPAPPRELCKPPIHLCARINNYNPK